MLKDKGVITDFQKEILFSFSKVADSEYFYLTGGTALAEFYFAHRLSYDLDFFTSKKELILPFSRVFEEDFKKNGFLVNIVRRFQTFAEFELAKGDKTIKVQLAYDSPFRFAEPEESEFGIKVNTYKDIAVDKLLAFFGRAEPRDAADLFFILKKENFWELAKFASQKDPGFDFYWLAIALEKVKTFPNDIERWPVEMLQKLDAVELKKMFLEFAREIMKKIKERTTD